MRADGIGSGVPAGAGGLSALPDPADGHAPAAAPAVRASGSRMATRGRIAVALLLVVGSLALWGRTAARMEASNGLFGWLGMDYGHYWAQAIAYRYGKRASAIYDAVYLARNRLFLFRRYSPRPPRSVKPNHVPYPPVFAASFSALTRLPPAHGFLLWTAINALAILHLGRRAAQLVPPRHRRLTFVVSVVSFPVAFSLFVGQIQLLLAVCMAEFFLALRSGREWKAGFWLGLLSVKPQYVFLVVLLLVVKRRVRVVAGSGLVVAVIAVLSLLASGPETLRLYPSAVLAMEQWDPGDARLMVNWRSLVFRGWPDLPNEVNFAVSAALGLLTLAAVAPLLRGRFEPGDARFPVAFACLLLATQLAGYHLFAYGPALFLVPLVAALGASGTSGAVRASALAAALFPVLCFTLLDPAETGILGMEVASEALTLLLALLLAGLLEQAYRGMVRASDSGFAVSGPGEERRGL